MGPLPISKGPEGDKLQGTIVHHFFRINFGTHYSKFKKNRWSRFCLNWEKVLFLPNFAPFRAKMGEGDFFQKSVSDTFQHFWIPNFMPNFKKIVRAVSLENVSEMDTQKGEKS